jgi:Centromere DNA-binding protein complex CBF3 subunit, domain 2/Transcriptional activator of glycolytic enzymes
MEPSPAPPARPKAVNDPPPPAATAASAAERYAALEAELFAHGASALAQAREIRPKNTNKAYNPKQEEWREFCANKGFEDGELVYENKVIWFLRDKVLNREIRDSRYKRKASRTTVEGEQIRQTLGIGAINSYVAAIVDLWSFQKSKGINTKPHPRGEALHGILRSRRRDEHLRRRLEFSDRAAGTLQDGYSEAQMIKAVRLCWEQGQEPGQRHRQGQDPWPWPWPQPQPQPGEVEVEEEEKGKKKKRRLRPSTEPYLRTAADFLLAHNMLLRSESRLGAELPDFFALELPEEGPTPCFAMVMIMDNGKTNQVGRLEYGAVMRHRNPLLCTMAATAFYLFYRWNIAGEQPPCFRRRELWYNLHLFKGENAAKQMAYDTQLDWVNKMFDAVGIKSKKKTHLRGQGVRHAELKGSSEGQIRRAGRWNRDALTTSYLTHLPRKFVRGMAGFSPSVQGNFYLPRAKVLPPRSLEQALWPWVDEWLAWFDSQEEEEEEEEEPEEFPATAEAYKADKADRQDLAGQGFLRLLQQLRIILLQDSVIMRREFPDHPIWTDPIFARGDYLAFAKDVELSLMEVEEPEEVRVRKALPALAERLSTLHQGLTRDINEWGAETKQKLDGIQLNLADLLQGRISITLHAAPLPTAAVSGPPTPASSAAMSFHSAPASQPPTGASSPPPLPPLPPQHEQQQQQPPQYLLSRTISTVPQLWREWTVGFGGGPSVQGLEDMYGSRWRRKHSEQVFYGRRKVIIDEIRSRQARGTASGAAVEEVELVRQRGQMSLYQLYLMLNRQKKPVAP